MIEIAVLMVGVSLSILLLVVSTNEMIRWHKRPKHKKLHDRLLDRDIKELLRDSNRSAVARAARAGVDTQAPE